MVADAVSRSPGFVSAVADGAAGQLVDPHEKERWGQGVEACADLQSIVAKRREACAAYTAGETAVVSANGRDYEWLDGYPRARTRGEWREAAPGNKVRREICLHLHNHTL